MLLGIARGCNDPMLSKARCPTCGARGNFRRHGSYRRWKAVASGAGRGPDERETVDCVLCRSCRRVHALIPVDLVPRSLYPISFRLAVLAARLGGLTVRRICFSFGIDGRTLYRICPLRDGPRNEKAALTCAHRSPIPGIDASRYPESVCLGWTMKGASPMTRAANEAESPAGARPRGRHPDNLTAHRYLPETSGSGGRAPAGGDEHRVLSQEAVEAVLNVASLDVRDYAMILLAYVVPLRVGELCALKVGDAHLPHDGSRCYVRVASSKTARPHASTVPIPAHVAVALRRYLASREGADAGEPLFVGRGGRPLSPTCFGRALRKHAEAASKRRPDLFEGVRVTPSALRRSMVSQLLAREVGLGVISRRISCPASSSALDYYRRPLGDEKGRERS